MRSVAGRGAGSYMAPYPQTHRTWESNIRALQRAHHLQNRLPRPDVWRCCALYSSGVLMTKRRFLRSNQERFLLWNSTDGKCAICECDLPEDWHADHIQRYCESKRTNIFEMQPLCPPCHWEKTRRENIKNGNQV